MSQRIGALLSDRPGGSEPRFGGGKLDASAAVSAVNALGDMTFKDVDVHPQPGETAAPASAMAVPRDTTTINRRRGSKSPRGKISARPAT